MANKKKVEIAEMSERMREALVRSLESSATALQNTAQRYATKARREYTEAAQVLSQVDKMNSEDLSSAKLAYVDLVESIDMQNVSNTTARGRTEWVPALVCETKPIVISTTVPTMSTPIKVPVGQFSIQILLPKNNKGLSIRIKNLTSIAEMRPNGQHHPHVNSGAGICWGNGQVQASKFLGQYNFIGLLDLALYTLSHYSPESPYIHLLRGWECYMPINERICHICYNPVVADNVYNIKTICTCRERCENVACRQLKTTCGCKKESRTAAEIYTDLANSSFAVGTTTTDTPIVEGVFNDEHISEFIANMRVGTPIISAIDGSDRPTQITTESGAIFHVAYNGDFVQISYQIVGSTLNVETRSNVMPLTYWRDVIQDYEFATTNNELESEDGDE